MNSSIKDDSQSHTKRSSLKMHSLFNDPNEITKMQNKHKRNSVNWCIPGSMPGNDLPLFKFREIKTSFKADQDKQAGSTEASKKNIIPNLKFEENRRKSIKNEFQIAKELMKKQTMEIDEEDEDDIIEKNTEANKEVGHLKDEDDDNSNSDSNRSNDDHK